MFANRRDELGALADWWQSAPGGGLALVWGRRRVGKTVLLARFAQDKTTIFFTAAGRPRQDELKALADASAKALDGGMRDLRTRPFSDWDDALETLAVAASERPLLLVLDEFPELLHATPELPGVLRAFWDRARGRTGLRILLCGSAVRTMHAIQEQREPLYGRIDLSLLVHPFRPHEAALMLRGLSPQDRARAWGILGGVPLYLSWWDQQQSIRGNLAALVCRPGGRLLDEGRLVLATEGDTGDLGQLVLRAIAAGRTKHGEIEQAVRAEPARTLERLIELRLVERMTPVTDAGSRTRRRSYRIADNFLAFWLGVVEPYRAEIERGLGPSILTPMLSRLDDHMGPCWEEAFRSHLRRLANAGELAEDIVRIGPFWATHPDVEIDAVALAGRGEEAVLAGEAKWASTADGARLVRELELKASALPRRASRLRYAVCARERIVNAPPGTLAITSRDIFNS
jgi:AAA+ ATPase superfamily predicted ATPase